MNPEDVESLLVRTTLPAPSPELEERVRREAARRVHPWRRRAGLLTAAAALVCFGVVTWRIVSPAGDPPPPPKAGPQRSPASHRVPFPQWVKPGMRPEKEAPQDAAGPAIEEKPSEDAVLASIRWLLRSQNEDGTWGDGPTTLDGHTLGPAAITSLALLSMLGAGYSHLSKDEYDGKNAGDSVRRALRWLMLDQRPDGTFRSARDGAFDQALAALALSESYGLTGSNLVKDEAQRAITALIRMQGRDGGWGGTAPTVWAAEALYSARISGLEYPFDAADAALASFPAEPSGLPGAREMFARILHEQKKTDARILGGAELLLRRKPQWEQQDFTSWYHGSMALFQVDGPSGTRWKAWNEDMKTTILKNQAKDGTWPGGTVSHTVVRTSLAQLTLEVYYRMANVYAER